MDLGTYKDVAYFAGGLIALIAGGQFLVRGAIGLSQILGLSPLFTGLVIVALGASAPELLVSLTALKIGEPDLAVGTVVGSNIANLLLILGLAAVVSPLLVRKSLIFRDAFAMLLAIATVVWIAQYSERLTGFHGRILVGLLIAYVLLSFVIEQVSDTRTGERLRSLGASHRLPIALIPLDLVLVAAGAALLYFGAEFLVDAAGGFAKSLGTSEAVIGLSILAIGTSLPELVTALTASARGQSDVVVGSIVGSCIFNILAVLGITVMLQPVDINPQFAHLDMRIMLAAAVILLPFMLTGWRLSRGEGIFLVAAYFVYIGFLFTGVGWERS